MASLEKAVQTQGDDVTMTENTNHKITLRNGPSTATILPGAGATLASLEVAGKPVLLPLHGAVEPGAWPAGGMPVCFPFAGRVWHEGKLGAYLPGSMRENKQEKQRAKPHQMPLHGFGFSSSWEVESHSESEATLTLKDSIETQKLFPWRFTAQLKYSLQPTGIETSLNIRCDEILSGADGASMPVAPGFHPYFAARHPVDRCEGYFSFAYDHLEVPALEAIAVTSEGNAGPKKRATDLLPHGPAGIKAPLHDEKIHNLIFSGLSGRKIALGQIQLSWTKESPWRHIVCWAKPEKHFFCVEPWYGLPDAVHRKDGVMELKEGDSCAFGMTINV